jgi:hypothetical protein
MVYIWQLKISNIPVPRYKLTLTGFNGRKLQIYERCPLAWLGVTATGARR